MGLYLRSTWNVVPYILKVLMVALGVGNAACLVVNAARPQTSVLWWSDVCPQKLSWLSYQKASQAPCRITLVTIERRRG